MVIQLKKNYHKKHKIWSKNLIIKINCKKLSFRGGNNKDYNYTNFSSLRELFRAIYYGEILKPVAAREQDNFDGIIKILKNYRPRRDSKYYKLKQNLLINGREMILRHL